MESREWIPKKAHITYFQLHLITRCILNNNESRYEKQKMPVICCCSRLIPLKNININSFVVWQLFQMQSLLYLGYWAMFEKLDIDQPCAFVFDPTGKASRNSLWTYYDCNSLVLRNSWYRKKRYRSLDMSGCLSAVILRVDNQTDCFGPKKAVVYNFPICLETDYECRQ